MAKSSHHHAGGQHQHDHDHDHNDGGGHSHATVVTGENERKILVSLILISCFMVVETVGGIISGSLALLADAGHMLTDAIALGLAFAAFRIARRAADDKRTFGYARFEVLAGFLNALTLFAIVGWIVYEAVLRFEHPRPVLAGSMFIVAVIGMAVNLFVLWYLSRGGTEHVNVKGAMLHVLGDLLGSVGAVVAAIVIFYTGWTPIDPILSVFVSLLILKSGWGLMKATLHILLEGAPDNLGAEAISQHIKGTVQGVSKVSHVHVWSLSSGRVLATLHIQPSGDIDLRLVIGQVEHELKSRFDIEHATIGIDWEGVASCNLVDMGNGANSVVDHRH